MYRKSLIGVVCIGMIALLVAFAHAYPSRIGGWGAWPGSVCVYSDWLGVANSEKDPTHISVTVEPLSVQLHYLNPAGNGGGFGTPFYPDVSLQGGEDVDLDEVSKNGRYYSEVCFDDDELYDAIADSVYFPEPPNPQWTLDPDGGVIVLEMYVTIRGYSDLNEDGFPGEETAHVAGTCTLNYDQTEYICVTEESWGWKKKDQNCPYE